MMRPLEAKVVAERGHIYLEVRDTHLCTDVHSDKYVYAAEVHTLRGSAAVNQDQCKGATPAYTSHTSHTSYISHTPHTSEEH